MAGDDDRLPGLKLVDAFLDKVSLSFKCIDQACCGITDQQQSGVFADMDTKFLIICIHIIPKVCQRYGINDMVVLN